jgi:hypothetical protein
LIAAIDSEYADAVAARLRARGVDRGHISLLAVDFGHLESCLEKGGFDVESFAFSPS